MFWHECLGRTPLQTLSKSGVVTISDMHTINVVDCFFVLLLNRIESLFFLVVPVLLTCIELFHMDESGPDVINIHGTNKYFLKIIDRFQATVEFIFSLKSYMLFY